MSGRNLLRAQVALEQFVSRLRLRATSKRNQGGQALVIVLGLVTMITVGTVVLVQNVSAHNPLVEQDLLEHEAYRAMESGINEYLSKVNANPDYVVCPPAEIETGYPGSWSSPVSPNLSSGLCTGLTYQTWTSVPNTATTKGPPAWFLFGNPIIFDCTTTSKCPSPDVWVSMQVVGASGYKTTMNYSTATVTFQPTNSFLLNLWWLNYDDEDPQMVGGSSCGYYDSYASAAAYVAGPCQPVDLITGETLVGNIFSNDVIFICGSPTIDGTVESASSQGTVADPTSGGCTDSPSAGSGYTYSVQTNQPSEPIPTEDDVLATVAAETGCLYQGPTEILLAENTSVTPAVWEMEVTSPDTATDGSSSGANDADNDAGNTNPCMPTTSGGWVPYPTNGVIFVENCSSSNTKCTGSGAFNPLSFYNSSDPSEYGQSSATDGDAIVEGTINSPLTIASQDNVVITGDVCYNSFNSGSLTTLSTGAGSAAVSTNCGTAPSTPSGDVLGLVSYNYVELNHPYNGSYGSSVPTCASNMATYGTSGSLDCDLDPSSGTTYVDAAILALNDQFWVTYFDQGNPDGNLEVNGAISEDWRGPVGQFGGSGPIHGYSKDYLYDQRLGYLSPPDYLNPGTASWQIGSIDTTRTPCPTTLCSAFP
jgi:hypothetical protein